MPLYRVTHKGYMNRRLYRPDDTFNAPTGMKSSWFVEVEPDPVQLLQEMAESSKRTRKPKDE